LNPLSLHPLASERTAVFSSSDPRDPPKREIK
jgi:hypothetical protein